jgi:hypothetical protein
VQHSRPDCENPIKIGIPLQSAIEFLAASGFSARRAGATTAGGTESAPQETFE